MKKVLTVVLCLALVACAGAPVDNLDLNGAMSPRPIKQLQIDIIDGGVCMPSDIATCMVLCSDLGYTDCTALLF